MNKSQSVFSTKIFSPRSLFSLFILFIGSLTGSAFAVQNENSAPAKKFTNKLYVVRMADDPVVAYKGGIAGLKATKPAKGKKIDPNSTEVVQYSAYLNSRHDAALAKAGGRKVYGYKYSFNGFAAELTAEQAEKMKNVAGVLAVDKDEMLTLDTSSTPSFLGINAPGGLWDQAGGVGSAGENIIIGIVDGGVWPEHPSFSDRVGVNGNFTKDGKLGYQQIPGWHGKCVPGEAFAGTDCNQKLIGAQYFNAGWGGNDGIDAQLPLEFNSPRDFGGHGSHTASTAGGNSGVAATGVTSVFGKISGIAPRARIAAYKVCWQTPTGGSCFTTDSVAAIDQAVADGVDVINFSISGSRTSFRDPVEIAFLFAADAGVFVAASAGNSGPTVSTVAHPGPWLTTVANGTHNRAAVGSVTLGNGSTSSGSSSSATAVGPKPLIDSTMAGLPGADPIKVALCYAAEDNDGAAVLDPTKVAGKIVVCDRGVTARVNKSLAVQQAGGVGMILLNTSASSLNPDFHSVQTVHIQNTERPAIKAYAATAGATATINVATIVFNATAPLTAASSSRGPLLAGNGDLLKPDLIAPGSDILAAVAPPGNNGRLFDLYTGTSMSSPHVAGLAAVLKGIHPDWSPMMIKSALMTTGYDVLDGGTPAPSTSPVLIFRQGAGHVKPNSAVNPGLVFDSSAADWISFLCGVQPGGGCAGVTTMDPSNLNVASIAIGDLAGTQTVTRTLTNVGARSTYTFNAAGLSGFSVSASPASFSLNPGQSQTVRITITRTTATLNAYTGGQLTWSDGTHNVRIPAVVRPVALAAPTQVGGSYSVTFGYSGPFTATARGMVPAAVTAGSVTQDPDQIFDPADATGTTAISVSIPAGTTYARFSLFDADVAAGSDIDMYVYNGTTLVGASGDGGSNEEVNLVNPAAGNYTVYLHGWGLPSGSSPFKLHTWLLGSADAGNMTVTAPASATIGGAGAITLGFSGLTAGTKYLGSVVYGGVAGMPTPTIVRKDGP